MSDSTTIEKPHFRSFKAPRSLVMRFTAKKVRRSAAIFGLIIGLYMFSKTASFVSIYPTAASREKLAHALGNSVSVQAMLGIAHGIDKVGGYMTWNFLCLIAAAGAIWGLLLATKMLRGEEDKGRWELLLSGQTTAYKATLNAIIGLFSSLVIVYLIAGLFLLIISSRHGVDTSHSSVLFLALALCAGAGEFMAVGALASQLMPARSRATGLAIAVFGASYILRAIADTTTAHWLLNLSPLGWIEKLGPMYAPDPIWLLPIGGLMLACFGLAVYLAGKRDINEGVFADKVNLIPKYSLLGSPFRATVRLTRANTIGWVLSVAVMALIYGQLANSSIVSTLSNAHKLGKSFGHAFQTTIKSVTVTDFLALAFFLVMLVVMFYAANSIGETRADEARGYLDNFVVRPVSRVRWLGGRLLLSVLVIISSAVIASLLFWLSQIGHADGLAFLTLLKAGANAVTPAVLILGIGTCAYGFAPRLTSYFAYGAIAWSFLILMLESGLKFNHWLLDTSILHHIAFAPSVSVDWRADSIILALGLVLALLGVAAFNRRDLAGD